MLVFVHPIVLSFKVCAISHIFCINVNEFVIIKQLCHHFNDLIINVLENNNSGNNISNQKMNKFLEYQSKKLRSTIVDNHNTNNWFQFYKQVHNILTHGYYYDAMIFKQDTDR